MKLLPLGAMAYFWVRAPESVGRIITAAKSGPMAMMTSMDMGALRNAIALEYMNSERWPGDIQAFAQANINGVPNPGLDRFGTPYRLENVPRDPVLVSCGGDRQCGTADDLRMTVLPKEKKGAKEDPRLVGDI